MSDTEETKPDSSVIYIGRLPIGFEQDELMKFFKQFGDIKNIRLSVNKKTGNSKHFAFIEFENEEVAKIVADTMDGYILRGHRLVCNILPKEKLFDGLFKGANKKYHRIPWKKIDVERRKTTKSAEKQQKRQDRLLESDNKKRKRLEELGIKYNFDGYSKSAKSDSKKAKFE